MNMKRISILLGPALLLGSTTFSTALLADWTGGIEGGQVLQGDEKGSRMRFKLSNSDRPFSQAFYADWIRGESNSNSYEAGYTPRYWFTDQAYAFGEGSMRTSASSQIDRQTRLLAGVGIQLIDTQSQSLFAEAGGGQVSTKYDDTIATTDTSGIALARLGAWQTLTEFIKLEVDADYSTAKDLVQTTAEAGISLRVPGGAIKYSHRFRSTTLGDADSIDVTDSSISFNYGF